MQSPRSEMLMLCFTYIFNKLFLSPVIYLSYLIMLTHVFATGISTEHIHCLHMLCSPDYTCVGPVLLCNSTFIVLNVPGCTQ